MAGEVIELDNELSEDESVVCTGVRGGELGEDEDFRVLDEAETRGESKKRRRGEDWSELRPPRPAPPAPRDIVAVLADVRGTSAQTSRVAVSSSRAATLSPEAVEIIRGLRDAISRHAAKYGRVGEAAVVPLGNAAASNELMTLVYQAARVRGAERARIAHRVFARAPSKTPRRLTKCPEQPFGLIAIITAGVAYELRWVARDASFLSIVALAHVSLKITVATRELGTSMWTWSDQSMAAALVPFSFLCASVSNSQQFSMLPRDQRLDFGKKIISRVNSIGSYFSEVQAETFHWSVYKLYAKL